MNLLYAILCFILFICFYYYHKQVKAREFIYLYTPALILTFITLAISFSLTFE